MTVDAESGTPRLSDSSAVIGRSSSVAERNGTGSDARTGLPESPSELKLVGSRSSKGSSGMKLTDSGGSTGGGPARNGSGPAARGNGIGSGGRGGTIVRGGGADGGDARGGSGSRPRATNGMAGPADDRGEEASGRAAARLSRSLTFAMSVSGSNGLAR